MHPRTVYRFVYRTNKAMAPLTVDRQVVQTIVLRQGLMIIISVMRASIRTFLYEKKATCS